MIRRCNSARARWRRRFAVLLAAVAVSLGARPETIPAEERAETEPATRGGILPLTPVERLRYFLDNLGEVETGVAYRSRLPSVDLVQFLAERANVRHVVNFRGKVSDDVKEYIESLGGTYTNIRMSASRPPKPRQILELIRLTLRAEEEENAMLFHCRGGADRTGMMTAAWRMLFQGALDRKTLKDETLTHLHIPPAHPNVHKFIDIFPAELFLPFVENPALLDDEERIRELEAKFYDQYPLHSGSTTMTTGTLRAGAFKVDLLSEWNGPIQMATYGAYPGPSKGILDPVYTRALVLENDETRIALVSCDLLIIDAELRRRVDVRVAELGIELDDLLLGATHTHTSIGGWIDHPIYELYMFGQFDERILDHLVERIAESIAGAVRELKPARLGTGSATAPRMNRNRRIGTVTDSQVGIVRVTDASGAPLATVVHYTAHPVIAPKTGEISGDFPGALARRIDERHGVGLFFAGALGDINARPKPPPEKVGQKFTRVERVEYMGKLLFETVAAAIESIPTEDSIVLGSMTIHFDLPPFKIALVPDLFFPLHWLAAGAIRWPRYAPLQAVRLGDAAIIATASEMAVRFGLELRRRSPASPTFLVTHANAYAGYALTQVNYAKRKIDPASTVALNGPTHGRDVLHAGLRLIQTLWELDPDAIDPEEPFGSAGFGDEPPPVSPTLPQTRRPEARTGDGVPDVGRSSVAFRYRTGLRGGHRVRGRRRETSARASVATVGDVRLDAGIGYVDSSWRTSQGGGDDSGFSDLTLGAERAFTLVERPSTGNGLRVSPRIALSLPTGASDRTAPFDFAAGTGVWRPHLGSGFEFTWNTYRTFAWDSIYTTSLDRSAGRRPGDRWENEIVYTERHGTVSLLLGLRGELRLKDLRRGGRAEVDIRSTSFDLGLRPGINVHFGEHAEGFVLGTVGLLRSGSGGGQGDGFEVGVVLGF